MEGRGEGIMWVVRREEKVRGSKVRGDEEGRGR